MKKKSKRNYKPLLIFFQSQWENTIHVIGITILAFLFSRFIVFNLMSLPAFAPMEKATDFQMSDIFQSVSESKAIHQLSEYITVVSIDGYSRGDVLDALNEISEYSPAAIGLDVFFPVPDDNNTYFFATLSSLPNLVCAGMYGRDENSESFHHIRQSFFEDSISVSLGYVNLNASSQRDVIREFVPYVLTSEGDTLFSMPTLLAKLSVPERYEKLIKSRHSTETISFENIEFPVVPVVDILQGNVEKSLLSNKILLVGDVNSISDSYLSPLHEPLSGIMLHAYTLQTILSGDYIDSTPMWLNWLIAIILCLSFVIFNLYAKYHLSNIGNLSLRIMQFIMIYVLIVVGSWHFAIHHGYIDFSPAILMIGFEAIAFDVWFGIYALSNLVKNKIDKK